MVDQAGPWWLSPRRIRWMLFALRIARARRAFERLRDRTEAAGEKRLRLIEALRTSIVAHQTKRASE
jgi:hypothetical protein